MERPDMKQNRPDRPLSSKPASAGEVPLWLLTSLVLGFVSLVSLIYYFFFKRPDRGAGLPSAQPIHSPQQTTEHAPQPALDIVRGMAVPEAVHEKVDEAGTSPNVDEKPDEVEASPAVTTNRLGWAIGSLIALVIAFTAQGIFIPTDGSERLVAMPEDTRLWVGSGIYLAAVLLWVFAAPAIRFASVKKTSKASSASSEEETPPLHHRILFFAGTGLYAASMLVFMVVDEIALVRWLWAAGLVFFTLSMLFYRPVVAHADAEESPRFEWRNWLLLAVILLAAFWLRFYKISLIPDDFHNDMAEHGWIARNYLLGNEKDIFGYGFYGIPLMGFLPAVFSMSVFGNNIFGLHMTGLFAGMLNILAVYLLVWRLFDNHRLAALTTSLTAINVAHIHFSRIVDYSDPWGVGVLGLFFFVDGLRSRRAASLGLAGVLLGIAMQMYFSGRALVFVVLAFLLYAYFFRRNWIMQNKPGLSWMVTGALVAMGPALAAHLIHLDAFLGRSRGVFIFSPEAMEHLFFGYQTDSVWTVLLIQLKRSLLAFNYMNDTSRQFGYPAPLFSSLVSPLLVLGTVFALRRWKDAGMAFMLAWFWILIFLGSVLTIDPPFAPRLYGMIPAAAFMAALVLEQLFELFHKTFGRTPATPLVVLTVLFLVFVGWSNWNDYYSITKNNASPPALVGRLLSQLPPDITACGIFNEFSFDGHATVTFMAWPRKLVSIPGDAPDSALDACTGSSLVWALSIENVSRLDAIRARWPQGTLLEEGGCGDKVTFYLVGMEPPADLPPAPACE
jgi:hypothetical protein